MNRRMEIISSFAGLKVLVIGESILDSYLEGASSRLGREAPVPIVDVMQETHLPGGAANTAMNAAALGATVHFASVIGDDPGGATLRRALEQAGVRTEGQIATPERVTLSKCRVVARGQILVRFDQGDVQDLRGPAEDHLLTTITTLFHEVDVVIISDYGYGIMTPRLRAAIAALQAEAPQLVIVDARDITAYRDASVTAVKPNYEEAVQLLGLSTMVTSGRQDELALHGRRLLQMSGAQLVAVTLDSEGALFFERGRPPHRTYARPGHESRASGAGDTFVAALGLSLAAGAQTTVAAELASAAASVVVRKERTATCSSTELRHEVSPPQKHVGDRRRLAALSASYRRQGSRVVFTNGCFDILHRGHIAYLNRAKSLGDILIVGVNTDEGVRRLKGPDRPINSLDDRVDVLAGLSCVDHIVEFSEETPADLIRELRPHLFVKGGDYTEELLPEARVAREVGASVQILPFVEQVSTTSIIERIQRECAVRWEDRAVGGARG